MPLRMRKHPILKKQTIALLDIGSGSVGSAVIELGSGDTPNILACKRTALKIGAHRTAAQLQAQVLRGAKEALAALHPHTRREKIRRLAVFIPAPWSTLDFKTVRFSQDKAFFADKKLIDRLLMQQAQSVKIEDMTASPWEEEGGELHEGSLEQFERVVTGIKLNGYIAPALPERARVFRVELMLAAAQAPQLLLRNLEAAGHAFFPDVTFHSSSLAAAHAISHLLAESEMDDPHPLPFLLCDGEGEVAELLVVRGAIPEAHATIPVGFSTIIRTLGVHGGFGHEEISSALTLAEDPRSLLAPYAKEAIALAQKECAELLGRAEPLCRSCMPTRCFIIGDGLEAQWFAEALTQSPRLKAVLPADFTAQVLAAKSINHFISYATVRTKGDAMLGLEALYAADRFGNPEVQEYYV